MEKHQSEACHCFFVVDNVLNRDLYWVELRLQCTLKLKRLRGILELATPYFSHFSCIKYWKVSKTECFRVIPAKYSLQNVTIQAEIHVSFKKKTVHYDGVRGPIFNCFRKWTADVSPTIQHHRFQSFNTDMSHSWLQVPENGKITGSGVCVCVCVWVSNLTHDHHIRYNSLFLLDLAPVMTSRLRGYLLQAQ
jgi:hypothetical protein